MNCHQILSGACNAGDRCYAVGSVEGISFTVSQCINFIYVLTYIYSYKQYLSPSEYFVLVRSSINSELDLTYIWHIYCILYIVKLVVINLLYSFSFYWLRIHGYGDFYFKTQVLCVFTKIILYHLI